MLIMSLLTYMPCIFIYVLSIALKNIYDLTTKVLVCRFLSLNLVKVIDDYRKSLGTASDPAQYC